MEGKSNLSFTFVSWWYGEQLHRLLIFSKQFYIYLADLFSVKICLRTLFAPWKRDSAGYEGLSLQERFQVAIMNLSSRIVGALVKIFTLFTFLLIFCICFILSVISFLLWVLYPLILIAFVVYGIKLLMIG